MIREYARIKGRFLYTRSNIVAKKMKKEKKHKGLRVKGFESMEKRHKAAKKGKRKGGGKRHKSHK